DLCGASPAFAARPFRPSGGKSRVAVKSSFLTLRFLRAAFAASGRCIVAVIRRAYNPCLKRGDPVQALSEPICHECVFPATENLRPGLPALRKAPAPGVL